MKISAEDVIFTSKDGKEATLVEVAHGLLEALESLQQEASDAQHIDLYDENGDKRSVADVLWALIDWAETADGLLNVKTHKPH